jgi:hypothetical protein
MKNTNLLIISILITLGVYGAYAYTYSFIQKSVSEALVARTRVVTEQSYKTQEQDMRGIYEATADDRARIESLFIAEGDTVAFIETLESLGTQTGSDITLSSIESVPTGGGVLGSIRARVEARGSWSAVMKTLMLAEALPYKVSVSKVRIDNSGSVDKSARREWRVSFDIGAALAAK